MKPFPLCIQALLRASIALVGIGFSSWVLAQASPDAGALQNQLDLQLQRESQAPLVQPPKPEQTPVEKKGQQIAVSRFVFEGNTLFTASQLDQVVKPWTGKSVYIGELQDAAVAVQDFYAAKGRIAQATLPPQEIKDGVVLIKILEGKMGSVIVEPVDTTGKSTTRFSLERAKNYITHGVAGEVYINTKPIERAMLLLNETPGVSATGAFEPGSDAGLSNFKVKLSDTPWFSGQAALSNYGSASTGAAQALASLSLNNLSGIGDQVNLNAIQSQGSGYVVGNYIVPIGYDGWKVGVQSSYLQYMTVPNWTSTPSAGSAATFQANTTYALQRSQSANSTAKLSIENRSYNNVLTSPLYPQSSYQITASNASISGDWAMSDGSIVNYSAGYIFGHLGIRDLAQSQQDQNGVGTAGSYSKWTFSLTHAQDLSFVPDTTWTNSVYGQFANKNLNSSEQIYLGGAYGVRAYPTSQGGGSQGAVFSTELMHRINENWQVGAFGDLGIVQQYVNLYNGWQGLTNANNNYQLGDAGVSARYSYERAVVSASLAFRVGNNPLYNSSGQQLNVDNSYKTMQAWVRASIPF
ncbi:ShlB/FhaC/HecB family hemolysin secretion/activation protein [Polynucleobacter paneuropaeus]|nr:ShlB/FhaC/HecB family hemolysin secretion/activation protein [Polynucleobacter paneuropaeus]MBT8600860.1 ShlB/FhaC/HecB family hemolysin secretion/activation protein [Polynucleobacter paneuropaeus]